ncbi:MAG: ATP-binding protein [bacterium]
MPKISIRARLIFLFTIQILIMLVIGGVYLDWRLQQTLEKELADKLKTLAKAAAMQIDGELLANLSPGDEATRTYQNLRAQLVRIKAATGVRRIYVFTENQTSLLDTQAEQTIGADYVFLPITRNEIAELFAGQALISTLFEGSDGRLYQTGFAPVVADGEVVAALALEGSAATLEAIRIVRRDLLVLGLLVLAGAVILGIVFSERITTPIDRLEVAAQKIAAGDYESEVKIKSRDEIGFLGQTLEEMRRAIVQRDRRQKAMLAGVAHEIRNPLGGIELFAGLLESELTDEKSKAEAQKIQNEVQNLKKIVNDFLEYARPNRAQKKPCVLKEIFLEAQMLLEQELNGIEVEIQERQPNTQARVDPQHFKQIFLNLMKNSATALNGQGKIKLEISEYKKVVKLLFSDSGPGIAPEIQEQIFEPFFTSRKEGTGLGLAIVKSLVEENGGSVRLLTGDRTSAVFEISLPVLS